MNKTERSAQQQPAVGAQVEQGLGPLVAWGTTMVQAYEVKFTPHADMVRDIKFGGAWFEVGIDCQEPDDPGVVTHPDNYWIECIKLGGVWWGAQDVLSDHMRKCLDEALQRKIAEEHREAKSAWRVRPCVEAECCYHGKARATSCACSRA